MKVIIYAVFVHSLIWNTLFDNDNDNELFIFRHMKFTTVSYHNCCNHTFIVKETTLIHIMSLACNYTDGRIESSNIRQCHSFNMPTNHMCSILTKGSTCRKKKEEIFVELNRAGHDKFVEKKISALAQIFTKLWPIYELHNYIILIIILNIIM